MLTSRANQIYITVCRQRLATNAANLMSPGAKPWNGHRSLVTPKREASIMKIDFNFL